ncbi:MAG TPA: AAA family ATPase, partial [Acetobacteraceae bacterium]|nr:AAA family ATPase [Acetobacteraceae bacterium]
PESAYAEPVSRAVLAELLALAGLAARGGHAVIADATFLDPADRAAIEGAARAAGLPFDGLWLEAPLDVLKARIAARHGDASDATEAVVERAAARDPGPIAWTRIAADANPVPATCAALALPAPALC